MLHWLPAVGVFRQDSVFFLTLCLYDFGSQFLYNKQAVET